jgi:hypothetical protein
MLVVDLLHEFELGVWKALFAHLIRILHAAAPHGGLVAELDRRYVGRAVTGGYLGLINFPVTIRFRAMPTFGSSTIRRFATNASEMKKLAARDFEDLLQVSLA